MTSLTISQMSCRSPSVRVIRSKEVFEAFDFFCGPTCSIKCYHFSCVDAVCGSAPPSSWSVSYSGEGDFWPSCSFFAAFCCSSAAFATSCASCTLAAAPSFLLFSANCAIYSYASFFFLCVVDFSASTVELAGVHHSNGHDSRTVKMTSSVARQGSSFQVFAGSLHALMYT